MQINLNHLPLLYKCNGFCVDCIAVATMYWVCVGLYSSWKQKCESYKYKAESGCVKVSVFMVIFIHKYKYININQTTDQLSRIDWMSMYALLQAIHVTNCLKLLDRQSLDICMYV